MQVARFVGRLIGWLLLLCAVAAVGFEATAALDSGTYQIKALDEIWYSVDSTSLNGTRAAVQRYLFPFLWDPVIISILLLPGWLVFGLPGLILVWTCRGRPGRRLRISRFS